MAALLILPLFVAAFAAACAVNGWALMHLWRWFVVPFGFPALSLPWAIGLSITVGFLTNHTIPKKTDDTDTMKAALYVFVRPLMAFLIGWVIQRFL
jgi:hypothetical protein